MPISDQHQGGIMLALDVTATSGGRAMSSAARIRICSGGSFHHCPGTTRLCPSRHPSSSSRCKKAAIQSREDDVSAAPIRTATRREPDTCCARAEYAHATVAPPTRPRKPRRLVYRESSILRGDRGRFMTPPPSRLEARSSFNHLVGDGEHSRRNSEAERLGGGEIDNRLEFV